MLKKIMSFIFLVCVMQQAAAFDAGNLWQTIKDNPKLIGTSIALGSLLIDTILTAQEKSAHKKEIEKCNSWNMTQGGTIPYTKKEWERIKTMQYTLGEDSKFEVGFGYARPVYGDNSPRYIEKEPKITKPTEYRFGWKLGNTKFDEIDTIVERNKEKNTVTVNRVRKVLPYERSYVLPGVTLFGVVLALKGYTSWW
jgi:hypothetical protein